MPVIIRSRACRIVCRVAGRLNPESGMKASQDESQSWMKTKERLNCHEN
jgi:hypothetical protein